MSPLRAWYSGVGRVVRAPGLVLALWFVTLAITLPPALAVHDAVTTHLGDSLDADTAASGVNYDWLQEFREQTTPIGRTLRPDVIGFAAVMDNTSALADMTDRAPVVVMSGAAYVLLLWFLTPGIIQRLAAGRPLGAQAFLGRCGGSAVRLFRLNIVAAIAYGALFGGGHAWLFGNVFDTLTRDLTVERTAFFIRLGLYVAFFAVVALVNLVFDFARIRMVVEDRHSVVGSIDAALGFVVARPASALGVYALNLALLLIVLAAYFVVAPGAGTTGWTMWAAFGVSQVYIAGRIVTKLGFWSSEAAMLQEATACPGFVRTPC